MSRIILVLWLLALTNISLADAGKDDDAGEVIGDAIRVILQERESDGKDKVISFAGTLSSDDIIDTYTISPSIGKNRFVSILVYSKAPVTLRILDKKNDKELYSKAVINGQETIEYVTVGPFYIQLENVKGSDEFNYNLGIWLAPFPEKNDILQNMKVGKNIPEPGQNFSLFTKPEKELKKDIPAGKIVFLLLLVVIVVTAIFIVKKHRNKDNKKSD